MQPRLSFAGKESSLYHNPPLPCPAALRGVAHKIGAEAKGKYISPSSPAFCNAKYRGGVRKDGGVNKKAAARKRFVLLAIEKNKRIESIIMP